MAYRTTVEGTDHEGLLRLLEAHAALLIYIRPDWLTLKSHPPASEIALKATSSSATLRITHNELVSILSSTLQLIDVDVYLKCREGRLFARFFDNTVTEVLADSQEMAGYVGTKP